MPVWVVSLAGALIGALIGGGSLWLMGWTWEKLRGIEAMGLGDVKMMFMVGAYLGWRLTILTIFVGVLTGSVIGIALMARKGQRNMQMLLPFGVFLGLGAIGALLFGVPLWNGTRGSLGDCQLPIADCQFRKDYDPHISQKSAIGNWKLAMTQIGIWQ